MSKKSIKIPHTLAIIFSIIVIVALATWILPGGAYETTVTDTGRTVTVPGTFEYVESNPQGLQDVLTAPIRGIIEVANIIGFIFIVGGAFAVIQNTGAINAGLSRVVGFLKNKPSLSIWIIPLAMFTFSLGGATFGLAEETIPFVLIFIPLSLALGYDSIVGIAMPYVGAALGFASAMINPFTLGVAQGITELPLASGFFYRTIVWFVVTLVGTLYVMRYASKIKKNPELSPVYETDKRFNDKIKDLNNTINFTLSHVLVLIAFAAGIGLLVYGVMKLDWYINEIAGLFLGLGILAGIIGRLKTDEIATSFVEGAKDLTSAALIVGAARGILIIATDGGIIDTILNFLANHISALPTIISAYAMFLLQTMINFFIPSGSGQAALTMPIMAPLGEMVGITRQTSVLIYQMGDGFSNIIIPTSGTLMAVLGIAKLDWTKWAKWILPLQLIFMVLAFLILIYPVFTGWTGL